MVSWAVLASIGLLYVLQQGTAMSATPSSIVDLSSSWAAVSRDVRAVRVAVASFASPELSAEALERIRPEVVALSNRLSELSEASQSTGPATVEVDEPSLDVHRAALIRLTDMSARTEVAALITALDALVGDADRYATMERAVAVTRIQDESVSAIRTLGASLLTVAVSSVVAALALIGFGDGLGRLERNRRVSSR